LLFAPAAASRVGLVRLACHVHEFESSLPVCGWLKEAGYQVGINLMQVADRSPEEIENIAALASRHPLDVLYFADSLGSLDAGQAADIIRSLRRRWDGALGIHTHDNMGRALANTLRAIDEGVTWVDSTVLGMGRGSGNAKTEYTAIELAARRGETPNLTPLLALIRRHFQPLQAHYGWGSNPYYYLAGQYGIHPTYVQEMLADSRYGESEILAVIEHLRAVGGKRFNVETLEAGRQMYGGEPSGTWAPASAMGGRDVLIVGAGPGVAAHRAALQRFIRQRKPFVVALNTQTNIDADLIDVRAASYPVRLLADCDKYRELPQPLVVPVARLPEVAREALQSVQTLDFGLAVHPGVFEFHAASAVAPSSLVIAYALAVATSGKAARILLAGFDGYAADDPRTAEMEALWATYRAAADALPLLAITPTRHPIPTTSVYAL
jgi:4-hydroxy 2-oxovalerate aldolase